MRIVKRTSSGLGSALFGIAITNGLYYYWYELLKRLMEKRQKSASDRLSITQSLFVGAVAGAITVLMTNPIWVVNTRLAAGRKTIDDQSPDSSPSVSAHSSTPSLNGSTNEAKITALECRKLGSLETLIAILKEDGPSSLWQGVWPALVLVANPSIQYMVRYLILNLQVHNAYP
jgi:adenine nucleotide transporter 17